MTIFELAETLPNGFHDAEVESIRIDYLNRTVQFDLEVWIGTMADPPSIRETYRKALLTIVGFQYCAMDVPDERYPYRLEGTVKIDLAEATHFVPRSAAFGCRLWVNEWNGFIHIAADSASLVWQGETVSMHA